MTDRARRRARGAASRHDHYPRAARRRTCIRRAASRLSADWAVADHAPGGIVAAIDAVADAQPDAAINALLPWLSDIGWLRGRLKDALALLAADCFARPPLRAVGAGGGNGGLILAERGAIRLTLQLRPWQVAATGLATALLVPGRAAVHVLESGGAALAIHRVAVTAAEETGGFTAAAAAPCRSLPPRALRAGDVLHFDTARESFGFVGGSGDVLLLELTVQPPSLLPIRAYDVAGGRLLHVAASRRDSSFRAMALTLLRAFGRSDAAPLFAAETESEDFAARWHAARELVALDPAAARAPLARMAAADPHPEIRRAAATTLGLLPTPPANGRESRRRPCPA